MPLPHPVYQKKKASRPERLKTLRAHHGRISLSNAIHNAVYLRRFVCLSFITKSACKRTFGRTLKSIRVADQAHFQLSDWLGSKVGPFFRDTINVHFFSVAFRTAANCGLLPVVRSCCGGCCCFRFERWSLHWTYAIGTSLPVSDLARGGQFGSTVVRTLLQWQFEIFQERLVIVGVELRKEEVLDQADLRLQA